MAELHQVVEAEVVDGRRIRVAFENGVEGMFDCTPYMKDKYWAKLAEPSFFRQVRVAVTDPLPEAQVYVTSLQSWPVAGMVSVFVWTANALLANAAEV